MAIVDAPFSINLEGDETGEKWTGDFRAKERLTHRDSLMRDQHRRELLGSMGGVPDDRALSVAVVVAELRVRLTKAPKWFEEANYGLDLEDVNILTDIYERAIKVQVDARALRAKKDEGDKKELTEEVKKLDPK